MVSRRGCIAYKTTDEDPAIDPAGIHGTADRPSSANVVDQRRPVKENVPCLSACHSGARRSIVRCTSSSVYYDTNLISSFPFLSSFFFFFSFFPF